MLNKRKCLRQLLLVIMSITLVFTMMPLIPGAVQSANAEDNYIDKLYLNYTTENAIPGQAENELYNELNALDSKYISDGETNVAMYFNVFLNSYTEPNMGGTRTQVMSDTTDPIDPSKYYYVHFQVKALPGYDFKHTDDFLDQSSVTVYDNGVGKTGLADPEYNDYWKAIDIYIPITIDTSNRVISVRIRNTDENVEKGGSLTFSSAVKYYGAGYNQVTWSVTGANSTATYIDSNTGVLTVGADETAATLTVIATSVMDSTKSASKTLNVTEKLSIDSIEIEEDSDKAIPGFDKTFSVRIEGNANHDVEWSLSGQNSTGTTISINRYGNCVLTIGTDETASELVITVTSKFDSAKYDSLTVSVKQIENIDKLYLEYTTVNAVAGGSELALMQELRAKQSNTISNGTEEVAKPQNVYLFSYTEAGRRGTRNQIERATIGTIDPDKYYYANFEIYALPGYDFKHTEDTFDQASLKVYDNGVETSGLIEEYYNKYYRMIDIFVPIKIQLLPIETVELSSTSYTYNGSVKTPSVTVKDADGETLVKNRDYTVSYASGRKNIGTYKVTVTGMGNYEGSLYKTFKINPAKVSILTPKAGKKSVTVKWKKSGGGVYYQVGYKLKTAKSWKYTTSKTTYKTIKSLKSKKYYNVKVRAYKKVSGKTYYGAWSSTKTVKIK